MKNTTAKSGIAQVLIGMIGVSMAILSKMTQKLLVERFDSFGLELQRVRVNR